jgi:hypothetical protein
MLNDPHIHHAAGATQAQRHFLWSAWLLAHARRPADLGG